jgi:hypothetical protein
VLKQTPLHAVHRAAGARMVDFGGWDMPVHYGSQIDEHHAVRSDAGMFDVSHMRVADLTGAGARDFLRYALANNVDKLKAPGRFILHARKKERCRRSDRLFPARIVSPGRQRGHGGQGHTWLRTARARASSSYAHRPGSRRAGPQPPACCVKRTRQRGGVSGAEAFGRGHSGAPGSSSRAPGTRGKTASS